ncbi:MAG: cobalamin-dependent protein [Burkholderiaceae bacterium]
MEAMIEEFRGALESLDRVGAEAVFARALARGTPIDAVEALVVPALMRIGDAWEAGRVALSQVYLSGRVSEALVERVLPPSDPDRKHQPRSAVVVLRDYHMLGKRIVHSVMRASGFEVFDYGRMDVDELVARVIADDVRVLMISTLMLPAALRVREVTERLRDGGRTVRVAVGGAPYRFDERLWSEVGADAMGASAGDAVAIARRWMEVTP